MADPILKREGNLRFVGTASRGYPHDPEDLVDAHRLLTVGIGCEPAEAALAIDRFRSMPEVARIDLLRAIGASLGRVDGSREAFADLARKEADFRVRFLLQGPAADLARAGAALKQNKQDSVDLDWSEVDVGQPEAGTILPMPGTTRFRGTFAMRQVRRIGFIMIIAALIAGFMAPNAAIPILIGAVTLILAGWSTEPKQAVKQTPARRG